MKIDKHNFDEILAIVKDNKPGRIEIKRGCSAARNGGCACLGICEDIIGYYENGVFTNTDPEPSEKKIGFTSYQWNRGPFNKRTGP